MTIATVTKRLSFEASHRLYFHSGKCKRQHGHSYVAEVTVRGPVKHEPGASDHGMVIDFSDLKRAAGVVTGLDHHDLILLLPDLYPTAENLANYLFAQIVTQLPGHLRLMSVTVHETADSWATVDDAGWDWEAADLQRPHAERSRILAADPPIADRDAAGRVERVTFEHTAPTVDAIAAALSVIGVDNLRDRRSTEQAISERIAAQPPFQDAPDGTVEECSDLVTSEWTFNAG